MLNSLLYLALAIFFIENIIRRSAFQSVSEPVDAEHGNLKKMLTIVEPGNCVIDKAQCIEFGFQRKVKKSGYVA